MVLVRTARERPGAGRRRDFTPKGLPGGIPAGGHFPCVAWSNSPTPVNHRRAASLTATLKLFGRGTPNGTRRPLLRRDSGPPG